MFITKKNRIAVYSYLFKEGTLVVKKDPYLAKHSDEFNIPNLEVLGIMRRFKSKQLATETFNWQYYYYILTEEGINYLREYLGLPADVVPATLRKVAAAPKAIEGEKKAAGEFAEHKPEYRS